MSRFAADDLRLALPEGYRVHVVALRGPVEGGDQEPLFVRTVVVARERVPATTSVERYAERQLALMRGGPQQTRHVRTSTIEIGGVSCPLVELRQVGPGGTLLATVSAYVRVGEDVVTLTGSHLAGGLFEAARAEILSVIQSLGVDAG